ncbi:MAG: metallophosphoesterase [Hyphomicrobiaceae bacterium]|nr:metallophosphoesterase [Hyphomicrobiaceae bacterium]
MANTFTLAHLSDIHLPPTRLGRPGGWSLKQCLGVLNWYRRRRRQHSAAALARLIEDLAVQRADHIAVTGDLVNLGLPHEYEAAARWLEALGPADRISVIPGNHDVYGAHGSEAGMLCWHPYMSGDGTAAAVTGHGFPYVRRIGRLALIGLNSGVPTPIFNHSGRLGPAQLEALSRALDVLSRERAIRVVLIHHPPLPGQISAHRALVDAAALAEVLRRHGAELVLHGHSHRATLVMADGPDRPIPVVSAASASLGRPSHGETFARYNLLRIGAGAEPGIELIERGLETALGPVIEFSRRQIVPRHNRGG